VRDADEQDAEKPGTDAAAEQTAAAAGAGDDDADEEWTGHA